jgi:hypothetical protein
MNKEKSEDVVNCNYYEEEQLPKGVLRIVHGITVALPWRQQKINLCDLLNLTKRMK